jgi:hypothetical protein
MNKVLQSLFDSVTDAGALAKKLAESGMRSVKGGIAGIPLFGALEATVDAPSDRDEMHYLLVPLPGEGSKFAIFTKRALPAGVGAANDLPKVRIFHVSSGSAAPLLEKELIEQLVQRGLSTAETGSGVADGLDQIANAIDAETSKVSGGLLLIGGAVAIFNPLLAVGIAATAILPSLGAITVKAGTDFLGDKLRGWSKSSAEAKIRSVASADVGQIKPIVIPNPILRTLDAIITNPTTDYDPALDRATWPGEFTPHRHYEITLEAIGEVYADVLSGKRPAPLAECHQKWLRLLVGNRGGPA